jgi:hypothetical protein
MVVKVTCHELLEWKIQIRFWKIDFHLHQTQQRRRQPHPLDSKQTLSKVV